MFGKNKIFYLYNTYIGKALGIKLISCVEVMILCIFILFFSYLIQVRMLCLLEALTLNKLTILIIYSINQFHNFFSEIIEVRLQGKIGTWGEGRISAKEKQCSSLHLGLNKLSSLFKIVISVQNCHICSKLSYLFKIVLIFFSKAEISITFPPFNPSIRPEL